MASTETDRFKSRFRQEVSAATREPRSVGTTARRQPTINDRISKIPVKDEEDDKGDDEDQEEGSSTKPLKKDRGGASISSSNKRRQKKNIREKRKSTGVVIMPGQPVIF